MKTIKITLPQDTYTYKVIIGDKIIRDGLAEVWMSYSEPKVFVVTSETVATLYKEELLKQFPSNLEVAALVLPDGEQHKHLGTIERIYDFLAENNANRDSLVIAFGGGVIGDMTGFAAATYMRGIPYVQIPTTLLSQVDSGIGGKTGVNHKIGKNYIGAFKQPRMTLIDVSFLKSLPHNELVAGYAELVKHGFIKDPELFQLLSEQTPSSLLEDTDKMIEAIHLSCTVKARVVEEDERESGIRAILNFGHTFGHFLETFTNYDQMLHGEAVIIGMDFAAWWSNHQGLLEDFEFIEIHKHLASLDVRYQIPSFDQSTFVEIIERDKKAASAGIKFIGLTSIGSATVFPGTTAESLWNALQEYLKTDQFLEFK